MSRPRPWEVSDELWAVIAPLLPRHERRFRHPGRCRIDDRKALQGVLFVLYTGIQWEFLPQELGFGSGSTCWRRLAEWQQAGVWEQLEEVLLAKLRAADQLDFSRAVVDSSQIQAKRGRGSPKVGKSPVDRGRPGSKHHIITDARGTPLQVLLTGSNRNDVTQLIPLIEAVPPVRGVRGRPRRTPRHVYADRGYDHDKYRHQLRDRNITPRIARRGDQHESGLGTLRWVVEAAFAWLHGPRKLRIRWETRDDIHEGLLHLTHCMILARKLLATAF
ncbi:IS5 family transposase [Saccharopolyspora gloriosae]|uniref:IS5 family transposase n=1 Tax=Saccharopolyspora gloriosae TaxID=455344 RepID=UPI001FB6A698|nr:IS5 family transposase [Saccharopolyspora gloriosae]